MSSCNSSSVKSRLSITNSSMSPSQCGLPEPGRLVIQQQRSNSVIRESRITFSTRGLLGTALSQLNTAGAVAATPAALLPLGGTVATISPTTRRRDPPRRGLSPPHETLLPLPPSKSARTAHRERTGTTFRTALEATGVYWKHFAFHRDDVNSIATIPGGDLLLSSALLRRDTPMKLGILDDIHEDVERLHLALKRCRQEQVDR